MPTPPGHQPIDPDTSNPQKPIHHPHEPDPSLHGDLDEEEIETEDDEDTESDPWWM